MSKRENLNLITEVIRPYKGLLLQEIVCTDPDNPKHHRIVWCRPPIELLTVEDSPNPVVWVSFDPSIETVVKLAGRRRVQAEFDKHYNLWTYKYDSGIFTFTGGDFLAPWPIAFNVALSEFMLIARDPKDSYGVEALDTRNLSKALVYLSNLKG